MVAVVQLTGTNVANLVLTLPAGVVFDLLTGVELLNTGNYPASSAVAPVACTIETSAPSAANQVQLSAPNQLTFGTGTDLDTTYGTAVITGLGRNQGPKVA
jgi:hypothetical protein